MATNIWRGTTSAVAQVDTFTPANVEIGDIFTLTLTDDAGGTHAVSFVATATTVANVTAGLSAAWNASTDSAIAVITAADGTTVLTLTADTAGQPFSVASTTTNVGGGADTQTLVRAATTASSGPYDYGVASNWSLNAIPVATNEVFVPAGSPSIKYSLNQSAVALNSFVVEEGFTGDIGRFADGALYYLRVDPGTTKCWIRGSGSTVAVNVGAAAVAPVIDHDGTASATGRHAVYVKGSALTTVEVRDGDVAVAGYAGDTATVTAGFLVTGGELHVGTGTTVAGTTARVSSSDAVLYSWVSIPTIIVHESGTFHQMAGTWTTCTVHNGATVYPNATGTYATTNLYYGATINMNETLVAKTFTTTNVNGTATMVYTPALITFTNAITYNVGIVE